MKTPTIYVMRHAEKPSDDKNSYLSSKGFARADKLVRWMEVNVGLVHHIFASTPSRKSQRPYQTVAPLAYKMNAIVDMQFDNDSYDMLASHVLHEKYEDKNIVVCWHHGRIPHLMHELGAKAGDYPKPWDKDCFDLILKVTYDSAGASSVEHIRMLF